MKCNPTHLLLVDVGFPCVNQPTKYVFLVFKEAIFQLLSKTKLYLLLGEAGKLQNIVEH